MNWVNISCYATKTIEHGWNELGTLPDGYRPQTNLYFAAQVDTLVARGYVSSDGRVALYHMGSSSVNNAMFSVSFPV